MSVNNSLKLFVLSLCSICFALTTTETYADGFSWPTPDCGNVVTEFGKRGNSSHGGFDISCDVKEPVVAMADGTISGVVSYKGGSCTYDRTLGTCPVTASCTSETKAGNYVSISHGNGIYSFYMHLDSFAAGLKYGDPIKCGQQIGIMGNTGCSTGTHLHFEIRKNGQAVSPHDYVKYGDACVCIPSTEICDGKDNDCDGQVDEDGVCPVPPECMPTDEICDQMDNDCDGQIDEDGVCPVPPECMPTDEICDQMDNDCDGQIDEDGVCDDNKCPNGTDEDGNCTADEGQQANQIDIHSDDDCACTSTNRTPRSIPFGAVLMALGLSGTIILRRRRDVKRAVSRSAR